MPRLFYSRHEERKNWLCFDQGNTSSSKTTVIRRLRDGGAQGRQELRLRQHRIQPYAFANKSVDSRRRILCEETRPLPWWATSRHVYAVYPKNLVAFDF